MKIELLLHGKSLLYPYSQDSATAKLRAKLGGVFVTAAGPAFAAGSPRLGGE